MGVIDGAHGYVSKESQMYNIKDFMDNIHRARRRANYTRQEFAKDCQYICYVLDHPVHKAKDIKNLMFELINLKLEHGENVYLRELTNIKRQKYGNF